MTGGVPDINGSIMTSNQRWRSLPPEDAKAIERSANLAHTKLCLQSFAIRGAKVSADQAVFPQFWEFKFRGWTRDVRPYRKHVIEALEKNDLRFFIRLGRVLEETSQPDLTKLQKTHSRFMDSHSLDWFLTVNWELNRRREKVQSPGLCFFGDEALKKICRFFLKNQNITKANVIKTRQSLHLKKVSSAGLRFFRVLEQSDATLFATVK